MKRSLPTHLVGSKVYVYRNLTDCCLSVKSTKKNSRVHHALSVTLKDAEFRVWQEARKKALIENQRNVNGFAVGTLVYCCDRAIDLGGLPGIHVTYKPFECEYFYRTDTLEPIWNAETIAIAPTGIVVLS